MAKTLGSIRGAPVFVQIEDAPVNPRTKLVTLWPCVEGMTDAILELIAAWLVDETTRDGQKRLRAFLAPLTTAPNEDDPNARRYDAVTWVIRYCVESSRVDEVHLEVARALQRYFRRNPHAGLGPGQALVLSLRGGDNRYHFVLPRTPDPEGLKAVADKLAEDCAGILVNYSAKTRTITCDLEHTLQGPQTLIPVVEGRLLDLLREHYAANPSREDPPSCPN